MSSMKECCLPSDDKRHHPAVRLTCFLIHKAVVFLHLALILHSTPSVLAMAASSVFTSAKTKCERLYTSLRTVLEIPPAKDKDEATRTLYDNPDYHKTLNPKLKAPRPDSVTYFERLQPSTTDLLA
jgi:hypothetical protein